SRNAFAWLDHRGPAPRDGGLDHRNADHGRIGTPAPTRAVTRCTTRAIAKGARPLGSSRACDRIAVATPGDRRTWIVLAAVAACTDHANPGGDDDTPPIDANSGAETWTGTSHVVHTDGAVYDNTFTFVVDATMSRTTQLVVQSGQVNITKQP